jgi:hypothetical protein
VAEGVEGQGAFLRSIRKSPNRMGYAVKEQLFFSDSTLGMGIVPMMIRFPLFSYYREWEGEQL